MDYVRSVVSLRVTGIPTIIFNGTLCRKGVALGSLGHFVWRRVVLTGEVVPYLSVGSKRAMGKAGFMGLHRTNSPMRLKHACDRRKTSRLIFLSVATDRRKHGAFASLMGQMTTGVGVPFAMKKNVGRLDSMSQLLGTKTSGISVGSSTVHGPSLMSGVTGRFNSRIYIMTVSTGRARAK